MYPDAPEIAIRQLAEIPEVIPVLARWFVAEWEPYYGPNGSGNAETDLQAALDPHRLPRCLVALDTDGEPVGTVSLRQESLPSHRHLGPWLAALLVEPSSRRAGIGTALVATLEDEARHAGFEQVYTAADAAFGLFSGRGWRHIGDAPTLRGDARLYTLDLRRRET